MKFYVSCATFARCAASGRPMIVDDIHDFEFCGDSICVFAESREEARVIFSAMAQATDGELVVEMMPKPGNKAVS